MSQCRVIVLLGKVHFLQMEDVEVKDTPFWFCLLRLWGCVCVMVSGSHGDESP